jgi:hypothetical protein
VLSSRGNVIADFALEASSDRLMALTSAIRV